MSIACEWKESQGILSDADLCRLQELEAKLQLIRDRVSGVVHRYHNACYLVGRPGISKTFTVRETLAQLDVPWAFQNARMTPMGLFCFLWDHPEHVIVLDDIASLFKSEQAVQILLAALGGEPGRPRTITYKSKDEDHRFEFTGGIVAISNVPLRSDPLARALSSRLTVLEHEPTDEEIGAFMRLLALRGYEDMTPTECLEVADFLIQETREFDQRLDLRHLTKSWQDFRQYKHGRAVTPWKDLVRTALTKHPVENILPISKREDVELQRQLVKELMEKYPNDTPSQLAEWPHSKSLFYLRRKEVRPRAA